MLRLKLWQTYRIAKGMASGLMASDYCLRRLFFLQHYCILVFYRIFATVLHRNYSCYEAAIFPFEFLYPISSM